MADPRPERWSFLDLRGGHHALDVYHEVGLVVSRFASFSRASAQDDIGFRLDSRENSPPDGTKSDPTRNQTFSRILRVSRRSDRAAAWTAPPTATRPPRRPHAGATSRASPGTACSSRASGTARSGSPSIKTTPISNSTPRGWTRCARPCATSARRTISGTASSTSVSGLTTKPSEPSTRSTLSEPPRFAVRTRRERERILQTRTVTESITVSRTTLARCAVTLCTSNYETWSGPPPRTTRTS